MKALDLDKLDAFMEIEYDGEIYNAHTENDIDDKAINVIPILDNATNGDVIKAMFPNVIIQENANTLHLKYQTVNSDPLFFVQVSEVWWNAPYKGVQNEIN